MSRSTDVETALSLYDQLSACLADAINARIPTAKIPLTTNPDKLGFQAIESLQAKLTRIFEDEHPSSVLDKLWLVGGFFVSLQELYRIIHYLKSDRREFQYHFLDHLMQITPPQELASEFKRYCGFVAQQIRRSKRDRKKPAQAKHEKIAALARKHWTTPAIAEECDVSESTVKNVLRQKRDAGEDMPERKRGRPRKK